MSRAAVPDVDARLWAAGGAVSVLAHVALAAGLLATLQAGPPAYLPEPVAGPEIDLHAETPDRLRSAVASPEALGEAEAGASRSAFAAPPRSRAGAVAPSSDRLPPAVIAGVVLAPVGPADPPAVAAGVAAAPIAEAAYAASRLAARSPSAEPARAAVAAMPRLGPAAAAGSRLEAVGPVATRTQPARPAATSMAPVIDGAEVVSPATPPPGRVAAVDHAAQPSLAQDLPEGRLKPAGAPVKRLAESVAPETAWLEPTAAAGEAVGAKVEGAAASGERLAVAAPAVSPLPLGASGGEPAMAASVAAAAGPTRAAAGMEGIAGALVAAGLAGVSEAGQAAAAWSGGSDARLDPQSLEAIRAFVAPAASGGGPSVRDGLDAALTDFPCSRLSAAFSPEQGEIAVRGHARDAGTAEAAIARVAAAVGPSIPVVDDLRILPAPQCALLDALDATGLPQSSDQIDDPLVVGRASQLAYRPMEEGESMQFSLGAAAFDGHLYIDYFDAAGAVIHITPSDSVPLRRLRVGEEVRIGGRGADGLGVGLIVGPPFGKDLLLAFATSHPLDRADRPAVEDGLAYLADLGAEIAAARAAQPGFRGEWVYIFVETFAKGAAPAR